MIGLSGPDPRFSLSHSKSTRFAESLVGKFNVPGVSGSFQKYDKQLLEEQERDAIRNGQKKKKNKMSHLEKKTQRELELDQQRLADLEARLDEIKKMNELKRKRERTRRKRRLEYSSACIIQAFMKKYVLETLREKKRIIIDFLIKLKNRQTLDIAKWAAAKIKTFFVKISYCWKKYFKHRNHIRNVAKESFDLARSASIDRVLCRKIFCYQYSGWLIASGKKRASAVLVERKAKEKAKKEKDGKKGRLFMKASTVHNILELGSMGSEPTLKRSEDLGLDNLTFSVELPSFLSASPTSKPTETHVVSKKVVEKAEPVVVVKQPSRAEILHQQRLLEYEKERVRRLKLAQDKKKQQQEEEAKRRALEEETRRACERRREEYLEKQEIANLEKVRKFAKYFKGKAEKLKADSLRIAEEEKREWREGVMMKVEDRRSFAFNRELPRVNPKDTNIGKKDSEKNKKVVQVVDPIVLEKQRKMIEETKKRILEKAKLKEQQAKEQQLELERKIEQKRLVLEKAKRQLMKSIRKPPLIINDYSILDNNNLIGSKLEENEDNGEDNDYDDDAGNDEGGVEDHNDDDVHESDDDNDERDFDDKCGDNEDNSGEDVNERMHNNLDDASTLTDLNNYDNIDPTDETIEGDYVGENKPKIKKGAKNSIPSNPVAEAGEMSHIQFDFEDFIRNTNDVTQVVINKPPDATSGFDLEIVKPTKAPHITKIEKQRIKERKIEYMKKKRKENWSKLKQSPYFNHPHEFVLDGGNQSNKTNSAFESVVDHLMMQQQSKFQSLKDPSKGGKKGRIADLMEMISQARDVSQGENQTAGSNAAGIINSNRDGFDVPPPPRPLNELSSNAGETSNTSSYPLPGSLTSNNGHKLSTNPLFMMVPPSLHLTPTTVTVKPATIITQYENIGVSNSNNNVKEREVESKSKMETKDLKDKKINKLGNVAVGSKPEKMKSDVKEKATVVIEGLTSTKPNSVVSSTSTNKTKPKKVTIDDQINKLLASSPYMQPIAPIAPSTSNIIAQALQANKENLKQDSFKATGAGQMGQATSLLGGGVAQNKMHLKKFVSFGFDEHDLMSESIENGKLATNEGNSLTKSENDSKLSFIKRDKGESKKLGMKQQSITQTHSKNRPAIGNSATNLSAKENKYKNNNGSSLVRRMQDDDDDDALDREENELDEECERLRQQIEQRTAYMKTLNAATAYIAVDVDGHDYNEEEEDDVVDTRKTRGDFSNSNGEYDVDIHEHIQQRMSGSRPKSKEAPYPVGSQRRSATGIFDVYENCDDNDDDENDYYDEEGEEYDGISHDDASLGSFQVDHRMVDKEYLVQVKSWVKANDDNELNQYDGMAPDIDD